MKQYLILFAALLCLHDTLQAQFFPGLQNDNYGGNYSLHLQPADIAGANNRLRITLGGLAFAQRGDLQGFDTGQAGWFLREVEHKMLGLQASTLGQRRLDPLYFANDSYDLFMRQELVGPALSFTVKQNWGFGFFTRMRSFHEVRNLDSDLFTLFAGDGGTINTDQRLMSSELRMQSLSFGELGFAAGGILLDNQTHRLKFGLRYKFLLGAAAMYFQGDNIEYEIKPSGQLRIYELDALYAHSVRYYDGNEDWAEDVRRSKGWGGDLGLVYEYRPDAMRHSSGLWDQAQVRADEPAYLFKVGFSILDMGRIRFDRSANSEDFSPSTVLPLVIDSLLPRPVSQLDSIIAGNFILDGGGSQMLVHLPTHLSFQFDYRLQQRFFLNATALLSRGKTDSVDPLMFRFPSRFTLSPRYEGKQMMLGLPLSFVRGADGLNGQLGLSIRLGPLSLASNNVLSALFNKVSSNPLSSGRMDGFATLQFNLAQKRP